MRRLIVDLVDEQTELTRKVMAASLAEDPPGEAVAAWSESRRPCIERAGRTLAEIEQSGDPWSFAKLTLAHSGLREVAAS